MEDFKKMIKKALTPDHLKEGMDIYDDIANEEFGMDYDQLGSNEKEWVRDEIDNMSFRESVNEETVDYDFSKKELIRVIKQLKTGASTEVGMIKAFEKALGRELTDDEIRGFKLNEVHKLLRQSKLSSEEYQKAKKLKGFSKDDYQWNSDENLYVKSVNEEHDCEAAHPDQSHEEWEHEHVKNLLKRNFMDEAEARVDEIDMNDPALIAARAAKMADEKEKAKQTALDKKYGSSFMDKLDAELDLKQELADLEDEREDVLRNMEEEAEPEGGPIADDYGSILNDIDARMAEIKSELDDLRMYESVNEITTTPVSGTKAGVTYSLDNRKYVLTNDVKGARIGDYTNITLPKGTVIYNLPGGLMADHESLRQYAKLSGNIYFDKPTYAGIGIRRMPDILTAIENNSNVIEESLNEEFKVGDKVTYLGHPAVVTATKEYNGRDFVSVSYDKGTGKTKASDILVKSGTVKAVNEMEDEMLFLDKLRKGHAEESVNLEDFMKTMKTMYGKAAGSDDELEAAYEKFRVTNPNLEEESDTDVGGGAKQAIGLDIDDEGASDAALDNEVEKMGYNESKKFDFKKMVKEALTPDYLKK